MERSNSAEDGDAIPKCSICWNTMNDAVDMTPCGHRFCHQCITTWLRSNDQCPSCRNYISTSQLIQDREWPEIVQRMREMNSLLQSPASGNNQNMINVSTDSPLWDQNIQHTKKLLQFKEKELGRLKARIEACNNEKQQLKEEVERLKTQIVSLPSLKEKNRQLEDHVKTKQTEIVTLNGKIYNATSTIASLRANVDIFKKAKAAHDKTESTLYADIQKKSDDLEHFTNENERLTKENKQLEADVQQKVSEIKEVTDENETLNTQLTSAKEEVQNLSVELKKTQDQALFLWNRMNQLQVYEQYCTEKDKVLLELSGVTFPERNQTIGTLQIKVAQLVEELEIVRRDTIPIGVHTSQLQSELQKTRKNLQESYETARDANIKFIEDERKVWEQRLALVQSQLKSQSEIGELSTSTPTYKILLNENFELQDQVKFLKQRLHVNESSPTEENDSFNESMLKFGRDN
ncbi:hypothetical protein ACF0H5_012368 [Mactra antiquata]